MVEKNLIIFKSICISYAIVLMVLFSNSENEINTCSTNIKTTYNFRLLLNCTFYFTVISLLMTIFDYRDSREKFLAFIHFLAMKGSVISGCVLFFSVILPLAKISVCSTNIIVVSVLSSIGGIICFFLLSLGFLVIVGFMIYILLIFVTSTFIQPFYKLSEKFDALRCCFVISLAWFSLMIWSLISYTPPQQVFVLTTAQLIIFYFTVILKKDVTTYSLSGVLLILSIIGIINIIIEFFTNSGHISPSSYIAISTLGMFPLYFLLKKIFDLKEKCYSFNEQNDQEMNNSNRNLVNITVTVSRPKEPPAIYASGMELV